MNEDINVIITDNEEVVTMTSSEEYSKAVLEQAMYNFQVNRHYNSQIFKSPTTTNTTLTVETIDTLSNGAQSDLRKITDINAYVLSYITKNGNVGKVYEALENNLNSDFRLMFPNIPKKGSSKKMEKAKDVIDNFNQVINIKKLIKKAVLTAYTEGNFIMYLRDEIPESYKVDCYPLGIAEISNRELDDEPYVLINISNLKNRLDTTIIKNKSGKGLFFNTSDEEIKKSFPKEIVKAVTDREQYALLDIQKSGVVRIGNMNKQYGVTPIFKCLRSAVTLDLYENTDNVNAKAKGKKIIWQKLNDKLLGDNGKRLEIEYQAYAHECLVSAWNNPVVLYTAPAFVEDVKYVEPSTAEDDVEKVKYYKSQLMNSLGIGFMNNEGQGTYTSAQVNIKELMKTINNISSKLEDIINKWYKYVLIKNNIDPAFAPTISVIDSELLETEMKMDMARLLFNELGASYETAYELLGYDFKTEVAKREGENDNGINEIMTGRVNAYGASPTTTTTTTDKNDGGRPVDNTNPDKQIQDQDRREGTK